MIFRVFRRFCEIQDIPHKKTEMMYDDLRQIVAKYPDLCKCPELKVMKIKDFVSSADQKLCGNRISNSR